MNENIEILQRQFDVYCTKVLKYASISYYHSNRRRMEHEMSFSSLLEKDLAKLVGVRRETIGNLEKGRYNPSLVLAWNIAKVFNVTIEEIFTVE